MSYTYPQKFDSSNLSLEDKDILKDFYNRRKIFDDSLKKLNTETLTCPGCGYPTISSRGDYEICLVCWWEDDNQDDETADEVWGGPNGLLSLTENRLLIGRKLLGLCQEHNGKVNLDIVEVLHNLAVRHEQIKKFKKSRTTNTTKVNDPVWEEYKELIESTLSMLIKIK